MRDTIISFNHDWHYTPSHDATWTKTLHGQAVSVHVPHTNAELPFHYFDEADFQFVSTYQKIIRLDSKAIQGQQVLVHFEGVMCKADIYLNGQLVLVHSGGYSEFDADITKYLQGDADNLLTVVVDSNERKEIPPFGGCIDYLTYGGIYREVQLVLRPQLAIAHVKATAQRVLEADKQLDVAVDISNLIAQKGDVQIAYRLLDGDAVMASGTQAVALTGSKQQLAELTINQLIDVILWDMHQPKLYQLEITLEQGGNKLHQMQQRIGFRTAEFTVDGFFLNGEKVTIRGLNRHQSWPYQGYAMGKMAQQQDADILKHQLKLNLVRCSHYMQSRHFLDRCDEIGLLVFEEIPGWQHIGNEEWKQQTLRDVEDMINSHYHHPSIILWGTRINESPDDDGFYSRTNALAKKLDTSRNNAGVRCIANSHLLEDVYTMNDFVHNGGTVALRGQQQVTGLPYKVPYLSTEHNGHMFPTKRFDNEAHLCEHAFRHLRVMDAAYGDADIAGTIGWCAFDYNTHKDFGSGDHICYHGVMDMFRIPKPAAFAYASQCDPKLDEPILYPATVWSRGERAAEFLPIVIFTNCDYIELVRGGESYGYFYPSRDLFKNIPHPPVIINSIPAVDGWGFDWKDAHFIGYVDGKKCAEHQFVPSQTPHALRVVADAAHMPAGERNELRVLLQVVDAQNNPLFFLHTPVEITVTGAGHGLGPMVKSLIAGQTALWVQNTGDAGTITIQAHAAELGLRGEAVIDVQ